MFVDAMCCVVVLIVAVAVMIVLAFQLDWIHLEVLLIVLGT